MAAWIEPQITEKSTLVTSEGAIVILSAIVGINCYRKPTPIFSVAIFAAGLGFFANLFLAFLFFGFELQLTTLFALFLGGWSLVGIISVGSIYPQMISVWRVEILTTSGPLVVYECGQERPARMVAAKIHDAVFV